MAKKRIPMLVMSNTLKVVWTKSQAMLSLRSLAGSGEFNLQQDALVSGIIEVVTRLIAGRTSSMTIKRKGRW